MNIYIGSEWVLYLTSLICLLIWIQGDDKTKKIKILEQRVQSLEKRVSDLDHAGTVDEVSTPKMSKEEANAIIENVNGHYLAIYYLILFALFIIDIGISFISGRHWTIFSTIAFSAFGIRFCYELINDKVKRNSGFVIPDHKTYLASSYKYLLIVFLILFGLSIFQKTILFWINWSSGVL
jgi:hypothetical protein